VRLHIREIDGQWHCWLPVADFARSGPTDRVFRVDRARRRIEFGNGLTGRIPRPDPTVPATAYNIRIAIAVGGGVDGDVGAGVEWAGEAVSASDVSATSLTTAVGGVDAETLEQARVRIGGLLNRVERAVTPEDHVDVARDTPGVAIARAHAAVGFHPGHPCVAVPGTVTVFVVPYAPRGEHVDADERVPAPLPDAGAVQAVRARLESARMVGTQVWVCPPRYRPVRLAVRILGDPVDPPTARARVAEALRRFLDPLEGGDDRDGWPFGDPLRPSVLMREASRADGDGDVDSVSIGLDGAVPSESCQEVRIGPHDLPALIDVAVTFAPNVRARAQGLR
jgi:predicted phage baseplate assembly protein